MKLGILLLNLGGPSRLEEVRPFLYNLFSDPDIIPISFIQKPLAWFIALTRQFISKKYYRAIGGGSPLLQITKDQAGALKSEIQKTVSDVEVYIGMRYWHPSIKRAWEAIKKDHITHLVVLPLYPQYSIATTGSSLKVLDQLMRNDSYTLHRTDIKSWYHESFYIEAIAKKVKETLDLSSIVIPGSPVKVVTPGSPVKVVIPRLDRGIHDKGSRPTLIFSAHSLPMKFIDAGDPYDDQIRDTMRLVLEKLEPVPPSHLCYQSRTGPIKWLEPSTSELMKRLSRQKKSPLVVMPISFISDHVETLYEIDILYRKEAQALGFPRFTRVPSLNCDPAFIQGLGELVLRRLKRQ